MKDEELIQEQKLDEENLIENNDQKNPEIVLKEQENSNPPIEEPRETKDSVQIHAAAEIDDVDEEYKEKCYSMKEGSILGGVFALSSLALGTGAFSIPIRCTQLGCVWYILLLFIGAGAAYWTLTGLIRSSRSVHGLDYSPTVISFWGFCSIYGYNIFISG